MTAEEYLDHCYSVPPIMPSLPLADEKFLDKWREVQDDAAINFLSALYGREVNLRGKIKISFAQTLEGKLPIVDTENHDDFTTLAAFLMNREKRDLPVTVNAFTLSTKINGEQHRIILLNRAPYSNISAEKLSLPEEEWLEKSHKLRLRHESAHYETLRLFGGMRNHALDEILADALGQIAAFGNFNADRQRLFFGLEKGGAKCTGRLQFYCQKVNPNELPKIYAAVDRALDKIDVTGKSELKILCELAGRRLSRFVSANVSQETL